MIRLILGGVGSGKSLLAVKRILSSSDIVFNNFSMRQANNIRLKKEHIFIEKDNKLGVNWEFWREAIKKYGGFHIYIDELHNLMHSRRSMSKQNVVMSQWVSQIRKVTGDNEKFDFVCISQELERIDISVRDLAHEVIFCTKIETSKMMNTVVYKHGKKVKIKLPLTYMVMTFFKGQGCVQRYIRYRISGDKRLTDGKSYFIGNPFFKYFDSYELINFGEGDYI